MGHTGSFKQPGMWEHVGEIAPRSSKCCGGQCLWRAASTGTRQIRHGRRLGAETICPIRNHSPLCTATRVPPGSLCKQGGVRTPCEATGVRRRFSGAAQPTSPSLLGSALRGFTAPCGEWPGQVHFADRTRPAAHSRHCGVVPCIAMVLSASAVPSSALSMRICRLVSA